MNVEHFTLFVLLIFGDVFAFIAALILGFYMVAYLIDAITKAISIERR